MSTMHELLVKTRNELDKRGHTKHFLQNAAGQVCLMGAYNYADHGDYHYYSRAYDSASVSASCNAADDFAKALGFLNSSAVVNWNNRPERAKEDVLARLDEAIARTAPEPYVELIEHEREVVNA